MVKHYTSYQRTQRLMRMLCTCMCVLLFALGCEQNEEPASYVPTLNTNDAIDLTRSGATFQGTAVVNPNSKGQKLEIGFLYSTSASLNDAQEVIATSTEGNNYTATVTGLEPGQTYYYCIFARSGKAISQGKTNSFDTDEAVVPTLSVATESNLTESSVSLKAQIVDDGGSSPTVKGFIYTLYIENAGDPILGEGETAEATGNDMDFSTALSGLNPNTAYLVRPYATNEAGTGYGESVVFTTKPLMLPVVEVNPVEAPGAYSATVHGTVTEDYGFTPTVYGFVYSSESNRPTLESSQYVTATGNNALFTGTLANLAANTTYFLRAYATNEKGTGYSDAIEFTTDNEQVVSLTQATVTDLTSSSATITVQKATTPGTVISAQGICYGTSANPDINGNGTKIVDKSGSTKEVKASLTNLSESGTYHARAYAISRDGIFYSSDIVFTTETSFSPSLDGMPDIYDLTETGAKFRHMIASNGGLTITEKGFVYSSSNPAPTLDNSTKLAATDPGNDITAVVDGLSGGTIYYVRSFATNAKGTSYSQVAEFTTAAHTVPEVSALNIYDIHDDNVMTEAFISNKGGDGEVISECGFVISPSYYNSEPSVDGWGCITFPCDTQNDELKIKLTGLSYSTLYSIRAYAKNAIGYGYSHTLEFETGTSTTPELGNFICTGTSHHSLSFSFDIVTNGGAEITEYGFRWYKSNDGSNTTADVKGELNGNVVSATITDLDDDTGYRVWGYAKNKNGETTCYGESYSFYTDKLPPLPGDNPLPDDKDHTTLPKLHYPNVSEIYATSAWVSSGINNTGNMEITEKGFLYAVDDGSALTLDNANAIKIVVNRAGDSVSVKLTGLTGNTRYRGCAYAINGKGVGYSSQRTFTTENADKPTPGEGDNPTPDTNINQ